MPTFAESQAEWRKKRPGKAIEIEVESAPLDECPTCGASGDDPCVTPSGNAKDTWHAKRGS